VSAQDTDVVNTHQAEAWNGYEGVHWAQHQDRYDAMNSGFNEPLLAAASIGERDHVLDIGCGNGQITRLAARRAPQGRALGVDLSAPMLERARATRGEDFARALRPLYALLVERAPSGGSGDPQQGPASLADPDRIRHVLTNAGFTGVTHDDVTAPMIFGRDAADAARFIFDMGPMRFNLRDADPLAVAQAREEVTAGLVSHEGPGGVRLDGSHWLVTATHGG